MLAVMVVVDGGLCCKSVSELLALLLLPLLQTVNYLSLHHSQIEKVRKRERNVAGCAMCSIKSREIE
jgi:hypothetical protein